jgi:hypothetical protein
LVTCRLSVGGEGAPRGHQEGSGLAWVGQDFVDQPSPFELQLDELPRELAAVGSLLDLVESRDRRGQQIVGELSER